MTGKARTPRRFALPKALGDGHMTLDEMELVAHVKSDLGDWATRILATQRENLLDEIGVGKYLPRGVLDTDDKDEFGTLVASLVNHEGKVWDPETNTWVDPDDEIDLLKQTVALDSADVAFVARARLEGADSVLFRESLPLADLDVVVSLTAAGEEPDEDAEGLSEIPEGAVPIAIVDGLDRNAVLELIAVVPGPQVYRRHDGLWYEDDAWVTVLRSVAPPAMVKLEEDKLESVSAQIDAHTAGEPFHEFSIADRAKYITSSAYIADLEQETTEQIIALRLGLMATAGKNITPKDRKNTEKLKRYWLYGKGAAKIRWGTPGAWTRCHRHLVKHMGPHMAPGYCTNLSQRLGGQGVATHVGDKR